MAMDQLIRALEEELVQARSQGGEGPAIPPGEEPPFQPGDKIRVHERVTEGGEGGRERIQVFEGVVLRVQGRGTSRTFTVRKESFGIGVEKTYPLHSPKIAKIEVVERRKRVRRARLYYLRERRLR